MRRILIAAAVLLSLLLTAHVDARRATKPLTFSILEDYDRGENLEDVARDFALMRELGTTTWRGSFGWDDYEPERGRYDFTWLHRFVALAAARGITLRPYLGYTPAWAAKPPDRDGQAWNQPPRDPRAWQAFVSALARELAHHANVKSLEIYNEENVAQWWEGSRDDYAATLRQASEAPRARRRFEILTGGLVFPDLDWVEDVCSTPRTSAAFDVLPIHAYPETWTPAGVTVENYLGSGFAGSFVPGADRACGRKRIWINEAGYATTAGRTVTSASRGSIGRRSSPSAPSRCSPASLAPDGLRSPTITCT